MIAIDGTRLAMQMHAVTSKGKEVTCQERSLLYQGRSLIVLPEEERFLRDIHSRRPRPLWKSVSLKLQNGDGCEQRRRAGRASRGYEYRSPMRRCYFGSDSNICRESFDPQDARWFQNEYSDNVW